jgi:inward rectifier potassium channel
VNKRSVSVRAGQIEFLKVNTETQEWRDTYHWILSLSWPRFAALIAGVYLTINLLFALLYMVGGNCIAGMTPGSLPSAFFFSIQTLATVGYGHMYPETIYGHIITTIELIAGMFWLAVITGLIFVRFSRPTARIEFSKVAVIGPFDGRPTLMLRVANLRHHSMVEAEFKIMLMREQPILEDEHFRHFYNLKLHYDRLITFPAALTLRHTIDEASPLYGVNPDWLRTGDTRLVASVVCIETVIPAAVQAQHDYTWREIRFDERFVEIYGDAADGKITVDYGRLHDTEPVSA